MIKHVTTGYTFGKLCHVNQELVDWTQGAGSSATANLVAVRYTVKNTQFLPSESFQGFSSQLVN